MRAFPIIVLLTTLFALIPGCASAPRSEAPAAAPVGGWTLVSMAGRPLPDPPAIGLRVPTLLISEAGEVSGVAGVNRFSGRTEFGPSGEELLRFGPLAVSRVAGPPEAMAFGRSYLAALADTRGFTTTGGTLVLTGEDGELLAFRSAD